MAKLIENGYTIFESDSQKGKRITKSRPIRIRDRRDLDYKTANGCTRYNKIIKNFVNSGEEVLIINDKASESLAIQKAIGKKAKIFLVNGPHSKNVDHKEKIYKNISELKSIL